MSTSDLWNWWLSTFIARL